MSPAPGTRFNLPQTQISFLGASRRALKGLSVTGSLSGLHAGRIEEDSDGQGASFLPASPFLAGETVRVVLDRRVVGAAGGRFSFAIATPALLGDISAARYGFSPVPPPDSVQSFRSRPDLAPDAVTVTTTREPPFDGDIFVAPQAGPAQSAR